MRLADSIGSGSTQATTNSSSLGKDQPFWDALNANVKNLHAVVSGHGEIPSFPLSQSYKSSFMCTHLDHGDEWCAREPTKDVIFCFDKHSG